MTLGGPSLVFSLSVNKFLTPNFNFELGAGFIGYFSGVKYHLFGKKNDKTTPYIGIFGSRIIPFSVLKLIVHDPAFVVYAPVGVQFVNQGIAFAVELAGTKFVLSENSQYRRDIFIYGGIKISYHF